VSVFARFSHRSAEQTQPTKRAPCLHPELAPRWDSVADMGLADRVTYYACTNCGAHVSREEAAARPTSA
jgi:hypothetical protein